MAPAHRDDASQRRTSPSRRQPPGAGALGAVVGPLTRTGSYYAQSWRDYLDREPRELPIARPSIALAAHAFRDEIVLLGLRVRRPVSDVHAFGRINAEVVAALDFYRRRGWLDKPGAVLRKTPTADRRHRPASEGPQTFLRAHLLRQRLYTPRGRARQATVAGLHRQQPRVRIDAAPQGASTVAGVRPRGGDGPGRPRPYVVPGVAPPRGSRPQCGVARPSHARPAGTGVAQGRGVPRRGRDGQRARDRPGGVGPQAAAVLDTVAATRVADRL